jgi:hypothetical protein
MRVYCTCVELSAASLMICRERSFSVALSQSTEDYCAGK